MPRFLPLLVVALVPALWGFTPFTEVRDVCPSCPKPKTDQIKLVSGQTIECKLVAQNDDYYVVSRFGELRPLAKTEVASIKRAAPERQLPTRDQVLLKNGVVLHGVVVSQQPGRLLVIQVGRISHPVWLGQVQSLHRKGRQQNLRLVPAVNK